jgi:tetratricopeptide (TPR) repeat protein
MRKLTVVKLVLLVTLSASNSPAQKKSEAPVSQLCTRNSALDIIQQQSASAKTFDNPVQRISVMLRAADLTWPYQPAKSRAIFTEAFEVATLNFKEKGDQTIRDGRLPISLPDQRYLVIGAIAKRDPAWARKLTEQVIEETKSEATEAAKDSPNPLQKAEKLFGVALSLIPTDANSAVVFARMTFQQPASLYLPLFIYRLAETNKAIADTFYGEALAAYGNSPMDQFLYLSSYPFANNREAGEMPGWTTYKVPPVVTPNPVLQRAFMQVLLRQAQALSTKPTEAQPGARYSEAAQIWMALSRLENKVQSSLPDLVPALEEAKGSMFVLMTQKDQQRTADNLIEPPKKTFAEKIEAAEKQSDPARREGGIALAILGASKDEPLEVVVAAADKLEDLSLRAQILSRVYFNRAQEMIKNKDFEEARRLASKVEQLDQRAYLYSSIVSDSIKAAKNDTEVREILEEVLTVTAKAPNTEVKARALLAVAYLYTKVDAIRSIGILGDAIKTINQIENPDFSRDQLMTKIEGKQFGSYSVLNTPGFNPENAFREMSQFDFDGLLYQAGQFTNKSLRSMATLALVEPCLLQTAPAKKQPKSSPAN